MKTSILISISLLLASIQSTAQNIQITPIPFSSEDFTVFIGMTQDDNGYIWLADFQAGLLRFDGTNLKRYAAKGGSNLGPTSSRSECITSDGKNIWLGTFNNGLNKLDPETGIFTHYTHDPSDSTTIRSNHIRTLTLDHDGMLWIGTLTGLDKFNPQTETFTHVHTTDPDEEVLKYEHVRATYVDNAGVLWVGTSSPFANEGTEGGLFKVEVDENNIEHYQSGASENTLSDNRVRAIFEDSRGTFWIGTAGDGLHTMDRKSGTFTRFPFDTSDPLQLSRSQSRDGRQSAIDHITFINEDDGGNIWMGTFNGGLCAYNPSSGKMTYYAQELPHEHEKVNGTGFWNAYKADDGLLWVSTWSLTPSDDILHTITTKSRKLQINTLDGNTSVRSLADDGKGGFYFGGHNGVWHEDEFGNQQLIKKLEGFEGLTRGGARDIVVKDNQLWIATFLGLYNIDLASNKLTIYDHDPLDPTSLSINSIQSLVSLNEDELMLGSQNGIQIFNTRTKKCKQLDLYDSQESEPLVETVSDIIIDSKKRIWISLVFNGIRQLDVKTGQLTNFPEIPKGENIICVFEDSNQGIWLGGDTGIQTFNETTQKFEQYQDRDGLIPTDRMAFAMTEDDQKQLWVGIGAGIASIDLTSENTRFIGQSWGINAFNLTNRGMFTTPNGELFLGHTSGYFKFSPSVLDTDDVNTSAPFISDYLINDTKVDDLSKRIQQTNSNIDLLKLGYSENTFSFRVNHIDYSTSNLDRVLRYRLEGYDPNWREIDSGERVLFYNIPPDEYTFESKVLDINGKWQAHSMSVTISPPWWMTWWAYLLYGVGAILLGSAIYKSQKERTIRLEREKSKDRELAQAKEIEKAYDKLELAHSNLKSTQSQLIQSEKMASLGELTAGIAHEIQNPLNFVNNFSEVSSEMIDEMQEEMANGDMEEVKSISNDIKQNLKKISHHGNRASSIVKGMLDHSRTDSSEKVPTDINALCEEYLRLSYHGLRAKDSSFNCGYETYFDDNIPLIDVVPQDIGRVLLNIINNAFYACTERSRSAVNGKSIANMQPLTPSRQVRESKGNPAREAEFKPLVTITTKREGGSSFGGQEAAGVTITITDNGIGMSQETIDKVFLPFFTTKPTGQGTGLGMSISYDIITKGHGGTIEVESNEGKGTMFTILLPN